MYNDHESTGSVHNRSGLSMEHFCQTADNFKKKTLAVTLQENITCLKESTHWMLNAILLLMVSCSSLVRVNNYCQQFQDL